MSKTTISHIEARGEVVIQADGSVLLKTSVVELGQGSHTILRQIAAEELGCDPSTITVASVDTKHSPYTWETSASKTTYFDGNAVLLAARDARCQLLEIVGTVLEVDPSDLVLENGEIYPKASSDRRISINEALGHQGKAARNSATNGIVGTSRYTVKDSTSLDPETGQGKRPSAFWMYAVQGAEIEVDLETGEVDVIKLVAAHDVGKAISIEGCEGQIEGALVQGLGTVRFEELRCESGVVINGNLNDYKIPCVLDIPEMIPIIVEVPIPDGPWGAKGLGEPGLVPTAPAIGNAFFAATGRQLKTLPFTPEKVLPLLRNIGKS